MGYSSKHDEWEVEGDLVPSMRRERKVSVTVTIHRPCSQVYLMWHFLC